MKSLPRDWETKPLGDVATLQRGFDLPVQDRREGEVTIFAANGPVGTHNVPKVSGPGVVTGRSGTLGKVHLVEEDYWPLNTALWVKDFHGNNPAWVSRLLTWMRLEQFTRGAGVPTLNRNLVHVVEVPLPPVAEQKRIAGILDAADALRAKRRESLAQLDTLLQSTFLDMFGDPVTYAERYEVCELSSVCEKITDGEHGTVARVDSGRRYLMARNVTRELTVDLSDVSYIAEVDHQKIFKRCDPHPGDLLLVCVGATIGKVALVPEIAAFSLARSVSLIKPDRRRIEPYFLLHLFNSNYLQFKLIGQQNVAAQAGLYLSKIRGLEVPVAPLGLQQRFATIVESVERQKASQRAHLDELDTLFASLQSRAFRGDL